MDPTKLSDISTSDECSGVDRVLPRTKCEQKLASIWEELLSVHAVGAQDNFFELGGHSLLATQLVSRVRQSFHVEIPLQCIFESPTVVGLAERIQTLVKPAQSAASIPLRPVARQGEFPLSFAQERLWFFDQLMPHTSYYNVPVIIRVSGRLNVRALEQSFNELIRRHETLRTTFRIVDELPKQVVAQELALAMSVVDDVELGERAKEADCWAWFGTRKVVQTVSEVVALVPLGVGVGENLALLFERLFADMHSPPDREEQVDALGVGLYLGPVLLEVPESAVELVGDFGRREAFGKLGEARAGA